ncbi:alpha-N-arabinofuranosidase [Flavobacteriaceae bacterium XHP0103]|uniref:alpha-N-arabinofuranosidase n=1 Tax=Marixanthotalea marina TaxID=2844359 RepID=UPI002989A587|nr:alpha-L-arabinofuranosidase C-terminal domain-containing protein [Marixanthotalea marina]MBU3820968.1 alpha-N-arabinofuranosidase [Marixanthotalea marina]
MKANSIKLYLLMGILCFGTWVSAQNGNALKVTIDAKTEGPVIERNIFGQFAEHLGRGIYEGVWVGPDSDIPNTRGIRNDVVAALKVLKIPNVRWPGGCFADEYHWRDGIGSADQRQIRINASWGRPEPNTFGTHEYFDFLDQIGADAYISVNLGSGTVKEAADWMEYLTAQESTLAKERAKNGHPEPYGVALLGIGNETWGCGGPLTVEEYIKDLKLFSNFSTNYNPNVPTKQIAVGPDGDGYPEYTEAIMKEWAVKSWAWDIQGLSLHRYTRNGWPPNIIATGFDAGQYAAVIKETMGMDTFVKDNMEIMDKYDPERKVAILVDEWGTWYAPTKGTDPDFLEQQNSQRDAIVAALNFNIFIRYAERVRGANIAQMINVLQAMILTDKEKMVLTPTYHAFRMYVPFQNAKRLDIDYNAGTYQQGTISLPQIDVIAAKTVDGHIAIAVTNIDPKNPATINLDLSGHTFKNVKGETLYAPTIDAINTFGKSDTVAPKPLNVKTSKNQLTLTVAPESVSVIHVQ